ncbi:MAG: hypothetical protein ACREML_09805 [Vulcanimicrobiaceae bacterium]
MAYAKRPHTFLDLWSLYAGIIFIGSAWFMAANVPASLRPTDLRFSEEGLAVDVAFERKPVRHYSWQAIRAINDIGESFVLVPKFGKRVVFPKRSFPDGGRKAWSFFAAHGVAGRAPRMDPSAV